MTLNEVNEACEKFRAYLEANGQRPIVLILHVCEDRTNQDHLVCTGLSDVVGEACLRVLCHHRGLRAVHL
jgi:hypothetical protein